MTTPYLARNQSRPIISLAALLSTIIPIVGLMVLVVAALFIAYQNPGMVRVTVGQRDKRFISGTHELEPLEDTGRWMRWTTEHARIDLPLAAGNTSLIFDLNIMNHYPHELADHPDVDLFMGNHLLLHIIPSRQSRHYRLLLPPQEPAGWSVPFIINSTTVMPPADPRPLGAVLVAARLIPTSANMAWPPLWQIAACLLGVVATFIMLRGIGARPWLAWLLAAGWALVWVIILTRFPMDVAPFTMRLAGLCTLGAIYGISVALLKDEPSWVSLLRLTMMMGVAYWLMPIYQIIMTIDGVRSVSPYPPTLWTGGAGLLAIVIGLIVLYVREQMHHWTTLVLGVLAIAAVARLVIMLEFVMDTSGVAAICVLIGLGWVVLSTFVKPWQAAVSAVVALVAIIGLAAQFDPWLGRSGPDFWILFKGAREWFRGGSLYNLAGIEENHFGHSFKVPPFYGMLFVPFVQQDGLMILFWHRMMNMVLMITTIWVMLRAFDIRLFSAGGAALIMLFAMRPLADTVAYGQIDIVLLLLLTLALVASQRGYDGTAGALIALATLFKLYPVLLLAFFFAKKQWRAIAGFAIAMLVLNGIAIAVMGWEMHRVYLFEVIPRIRGGTSWVENQTLNGFLSRLFAPDISATIFEHPIVTIGTYVGFGLSVVGATLLAWQQAERSSPRYMLHYGIFVILLVLTVPAAWMHYQTVTILTFASLLVYAGQLGLPLWRAALLGGAYALIAYGNQWSYYLNNIMGGLTVAGVSYKFYALLMLLAVTVACLLDRTD